MSVNKSLFWRTTKGKELLNKLQFVRMVTTLSGLAVRTRSEKRIADFLYRQGIAFEYEKELMFNGRRYIPDFYLPEMNIYIEFFGWSHIPSYQNKVEEKMKIYKKSGIDCIYLFHKGSKILEEILEKELMIRKKSMTLSDKAIQEYKRIFKGKYGQDLS